MNKARSLCNPTAKDSMLDPVAPVKDNTVLECVTSASKHSGNSVDQTRFISDVDRNGMLRFSFLQRRRLSDIDIILLSHCCRQLGTSSINSDALCRSFNLGISKSGHALKDEGGRVRVWRFLWPPRQICLRGCTLVLALDGVNVAILGRV